LCQHNSENGNRTIKRREKQPDCTHMLAQGENIDSQNNRIMECPKDGLKESIDRLNFLLEEDDVQSDHLSLGTAATSMSSLLDDHTRMTHTFFGRHPLPGIALLPFQRCSSDMDQTFCRLEAC